MKNKAFTLIELSIVLVIIGLIIGGSFKVLKSMQENAKITNAKDNVQTAKNAVLGYAMSASLLPTKTFFESDLSPIKSNQHQLMYARDNTFDTTNICALQTTILSVQIDDRNGSSHTIPNVAFVIASESANKNMQTSIAATIEVRKPYEDIDDEPNPVNHVEEYDDIVDWMTLAELQKSVGCSEKPFKFLNSDLPKGRFGQSYSATLYVENNISNVNITCTSTNEKNITTSASVFSGTPNSTGTSLRDCNATELAPGSRSISKQFVITIDP